MRFWDISALVPLCVGEVATSATRDLLRGDREIVVWWGTRVELWSALARRARESCEPAAAPVSRQALRSLAESWHEVAASEAVRETAERLLFVHPLRAAAALQLAAALVWAGAPLRRGRGADFVCLDERLRAAAAREGFTVLPDRLPG